MLLNINQDEQETIVAGLQMQREYIKASFPDSDSLNQLMSFRIRISHIDILLTKLNAKQDSDSQIIKS